MFFLKWRRELMTKYIFDTGGVLSSVGKGTICAAIGKTLQVRDFTARALGITIFNFIPPIAAALPSIFIGGSSGPIVAYMSGTLGTLIGADLLNLRIIPDLGSP
jgi:uncharacterized membrane protein